jgi:alcohol dehydrogenase class IV
MGLPLRLQEVGVTREGLKECAELALSDGSIVYNPRPVSKADEVLEILKRAF